MISSGMYKRNPTKQTIKFIIILGCTLIFGMFFGTQNKIQANIEVTSKLQSLYKQIKENPGLETLPGGNSMGNLYEKALKTVKENDILPIQESITQVTLTLNKQYSCKLLNSDITNIILSIDNTLRRKTEILLASSNHNNDEDDNISISYDDIKNACNTLIQCKDGTDSKIPHLTCQKIVYNQFISNQKNIYESYTMKSGIFGTNFFQNANKDDSIFDLLIDVEAIGNILFEGFTSSESAQILFYKMPERNKDGGGNGGYVTEPGDPDFPIPPESDNGINRYDIGGGSYPKAGFNCPENIESATNSFDPPFINTGNIQDGIYNNNGEFSLEENADNNLENTNNSQDHSTANHIDGIGVIGNSCIIYDEELNEITETGSNTTGTISIQTGYCGDNIINNNEQCDDGNNDNTDSCLTSCLTNICGDGFLKQNHEQCDDGNLDNGDGCNALCKIEKSPYCGDGILDKNEECDDGNNINNDECLNTCKTASCGDGYIQKNKEQCDDGNITSFDCCDNQCQNEGFLSPEDMALGDMLASFDKLSGTKGPKITEGCFQNCAGLPISDRILCMVDCTCGEISSPEILNVIDAGAFRLKYCMVPAESIEVISKGKTIFSIEEIFTAIKSLLLGLKDSGEMLKSVETKEFMESSMMKNDFGKMFAFNIVFNFKSLNGGKKNIRIEKKKAKSKNKNLMIGISNLGDTKSFPKQRNKYVIMADIPAYKVKQKNIQNIEYLQKEIAIEANNINKKISMAGIKPSNQLSKETKITNNLANQRTAIIAEEFLAFLDANHSFWKNMNQMFENMYAATSLLRTKIKN